MSETLYTVSTDKSRLNIDLVHEYISILTGPNRTREAVEKSMYLLLSPFAVLVWVNWRIPVVGWKEWGNKIAKNDILSLSFFMIPKMGIPRRVGVFSPVFVPYFFAVSSQVLREVQAFSGRIPEGIPKKYGRNPLETPNKSRKRIFKKQENLPILTFNLFNSL